MTLTPLSSLESARKKFLINSTCIMSRKWELNVFCSGRNDFNTAEVRSNRGEKIFDELDVHHVEKVGIKCFWAEEAEVTLTPLSLPESARKKFLMNSTYIMSRKWESNVFGLGGRNDSNTAQFARIAKKKIFDELDVHHVWKVGIKRFWAQEEKAEMTLTPLISLESARKIF